MQPVFVALIAAITSEDNAERKFKADAAFNEEYFRQKIADEQKTG